MNFFNVIMYGRSVVYHFSTERTFLHFMRRLEGFYLNIAYKGKFTEKSLKKSQVGIILAIAVGLAVFAGIFSSDSQEKKIGIYHITLADPSLYEEGIFTDTFDIPKGDFQFRFTPNGDSPKILSVSLEGNSFSFSEDFKLKGTPHETGVSVYYTWEYIGTKNIRTDENQELKIIVNPHENLLGPVSIDIIPSN